MISLKTTAMAAVITLAASAVSAATVNLTSVSGVWQNSVTAGDPVTPSNGGSKISWGQPATNNGSSSYEFNAVPTPQNGVSSPFNLGYFVHNNFPVFSGDSLQSTELKVSVAGTVNGEAFNLMPVFSFTHFETPNGGNPCGAGGSQPCPDLVTLVNSQDLSQVLTLANGDEFTLTILGFDDGSGPFSSFLTKENKSNTAKLIASFEIEPGGVGGNVPLPAAGWMLIGGLGLLGAMRRRQKAS